MEHEMEKERVCPVWIGYIMASPIRKLKHNPQTILSQYVKEGMNILDIGPGMGFLSIPAAKMTGNNGKVICVDLQEKMLNLLKKRASKKGLSEIIETRLCNADSLNITDLTDIDFALAFSVVHEVPNKKGLFTDIYNSLNKGGRLLFSEPAGHTTDHDFKLSLDIAKQVGFKEEESFDIKYQITKILMK